MISMIYHLGMEPSQSNPSYRELGEDRRYAAFGTLTNGANEKAVGAPRPGKAERLGKDEDGLRKSPRKVAPTVGGQSLLSSPEDPAPEVGFK